MPKVRPFIFFAAAVAATGCVTASGSSADGIGRLEQARVATPSSEPVVRSLGIAYYESKRYTDARAALEEAVRLDPKDGVASLYLGMSAEQLDDLPAARAAYSSYLQVGRTKRVRSELQARLAALSRKELGVAAKSAIRDERQLASVPGTPNTVAVLPLSFSGPDTSLKPLERGLTELIVTDLSRSPQLTVLERLRIQTLLDELNLQQSGVTDSSTQMRAGRILQAGRVVEGSIVQQGQQLRVDAAVIDVPTTQVSGQVNDDRALDELFTLEKNIVFGLFDRMQVVLTTAQRNAIEQRPTRSLAAFLAYSRGLSLEDQGRYDAARSLFQEAARLDPSFGAAQQKAQESQRLAVGSQITTQTVEASLKGTPEGQVVQAATQGVVASSNSTNVSTVNTVQSTADGLNPSPSGTAATGGVGTNTNATQKDGATSGTGLDTPTNRTAKITIVIHKP